MRASFISGLITAASCLLAGWLGLSPSICKAETPHRPNIILIMADDLGYGELGCFGQEKIKTPHLDQLAAEGMRFTQHYSGSPVCAPSRCVLLTGQHTGHAEIRNNREAKPEGQAPISTEAVTMAELLKKAGYATAAIGKWGLGPPGSSGDPLKQGFDLFFGYNCQRHAHNYYPTYLWRNDERVPLNNPPFQPRQKFPEGKDPNDPANYRGYTGRDYAPDLMTGEALKFIHEKQHQPFFLYLAYTIPHVAIQVPGDSLTSYEGAFPETPYLGDQGYLPHRTPRAGYAAMISRMDGYVGRIMVLLEQLGLDENTIVLFTSDNGPTYNGGSDSAFFHSAGPLRGLKANVYEGGIRIPLIARWPNRIPGGSTSNHISAFWDILPTLCELAGTEPPDDIDGISFVPTLLQRGPQKQHDCLYWEFTAYDGQQALRLGRWKGVRQNMFRGNMRIELYDLDSDIGETREVSRDHPDVVARIEQLMNASRRPSERFPFEQIDP